MIFILVFLIFLNRQWFFLDRSFPAPSAPKGNNKFETLLVKVFSLKTKKQYFQLLQKKTNFYFPRKQSMFPLDKGLQ